MSIHRLDHWFDDYGAHHQTRGNKLLHRIGIPLIVFSLIGMLEQVELISLGEFTLDLALVLLVVSLFFYLSIDARLGSLMTVVLIAMYLLAPFVPLLGHVAMFVGGWILQFVGHGVYEKRQPAFLRNVTHLLVGPLWVLNDLTGRASRRRN